MGGEIPCEPAEVSEGGMHTIIEANAFSLVVVKGFLEVAEQTACTRDSKHHAAQLPKDLLPLEEHNAFLCQRDGGEYVLEAGDMMWG
jgi:hypothetical protein